MEKALDQFLTQTYIMDKVLSHVDIFNDASNGVLNPQELGKLNKLSKRLADASSSTRNLLEMRDKFVRRNLEKKNKEVDEMLSKFQVPITCPAKPQMPGGRILEEDEIIEKDGISMRKPREETVKVPFRTGTCFHCLEFDPTVTLEYVCDKCVSYLKEMDKEQE